MSNSLKVLVATDNHLGVHKRCPVRVEDSFATMEEIFQIGEDAGVDMVLLGGDLFHDSKPSRRTMVRALEMFKRRCLGQNPVRIQVDNYENVNFEDENMSVHLPAFIIHGNHDDPTRDGNLTSLSSVDVLKTAGLVNYFGKIADFSNARVKPVLIRKGDVKLALYGIGWMRDERLNAMFEKGEVVFERPDESEGSWFNVFTVHQNADSGRGAKNCFRESHIPEFINITVWGHEHECLVDLREARNTFGDSCTTTYISQLGSSVATSLIEGEAVDKHVAILELRADGGGNQQYRWTKKRLTSVRPFAYEEIVLSDVDGLNDLDEGLPEAEKRDIVFKLLSERVSNIIEATKSAGEHDGRYCEHLKNADGDVMPIVRLRVEHTGFPTLNKQHFGQQFIQKVANPGEILRFFKRKQKVSSKRSGTGAGQGGTDLFEAAASVDDRASSHAKITTFVAANLNAGEKKLRVLDEKKMERAIEAFVNKEETQAIIKSVMDQLSSVRGVLESSSREGLSEDKIAEVLKSNEAREEAGKENEAQMRKRAAPRSTKQPKRKRMTKKKADIVNISDDDDDDDDDWKHSADPSSVYVQDSAEDEDEDEEVRVPSVRRSPRRKAQKRAASSTATSRSTSKARSRYGAPKRSRR